MRKKQTTCKYGHPYSGNNLGIYGTTGKRYCRECRRRDHRGWWKRKNPNPRPVGAPPKLMPIQRPRLKLPDHPLAYSGGYVITSRKILYDKIGPGPHSCHWCKRSIDWIVMIKGKTRMGIVGDHLDNNWRNNSPENLVPACQRCNGTRWRHKSKFILP